MALKDITITGSINSYPTLSYGQKTYIASTDEQSFPIEHITGSAGGATPDFNGQVATTNLFVNITQSWPGSNNTPLGLVDFVHDTEEEFINGEYSGSAIQVADQRLIDEDCIQYLTPSTIPTNFKLYFYNTPTFPLITTGDDPEYLTAKAYRDNFLNPNTSPNPGEIYILTTVSEKFGVSPILPPQGKLLVSYATWIFGLSDFTSGLNVVSKWTILNNGAQTLRNGDFINLSLYGYIINGGSLQLSDPTDPNYDVTVGTLVASRTPTYEPPVYRDDGYGLVPINYVDFVNNQLNIYGLSTRITGSSITSGRLFIANYFESETFTFIFREIGQINGNPLPNVYYILYSNQGNIYDAIVFGTETDVQTYLDNQYGAEWPLYTP
jgi:hypothetical protein